MLLLAPIQLEQNVPRDPEQERAHARFSTESVRAFGEPEKRALRQILCMLEGLRPEEARDGLVIAADQRLSGAAIPTVPRTKQRDVVTCAGVGAHVRPQLGKRQGCPSRAYPTRNSVLRRCARMSGARSLAVASSKRPSRKRG